MYTNKVFAWLAAGAIGLGSSAAIAQYEPEDEDAPGIQQQEQLHEAEDEAVDPLGVEEEEAVEQEALAIDDEAEQQSLQGTVIDATSYLIHGEEAIERHQDPQQFEQEHQEQQQQQEQQEQPFDEQQQEQEQLEEQQQEPQQFGQQQQPMVLVTEEGEAYLILEKPMDEMDNGLQQPLEEPAEEPAEIEQFEQEQEQEVEPRTGVRSPVRDRIAPRADHGMRHGIAQREQERAWERHPGEWREDADDPQPQHEQQQEQLMEDEPEQVDPAGMGESRVYQELEIGQQVTLTGAVHERGGLRGIVIDEYGIEHDDLEAPLEAPADDIDEPEAEVEEDLELETEDVEQQ